MKKSPSVLTHRMQEIKLVFTVWKPAIWTSFTKAPKRDFISRLLTLSANHNTETACISSAAVLIVIYCASDCLLKLGNITDSLWYSKIHIDTYLKPFFMEVVIQCYCASIQRMINWVFWSRLLLSEMDVWDKKITFSKHHNG